MSDQLPEYRIPPLNEVVMGIQFEPIKKLSTGRIGLFWNRMKDRYPDTQDHPPLSHVVESFAEAWQKKQTPTSPRIISPRCWMIDKSGCQLLQLQEDRFHRNWRKVDGSEQYPRFSALYEVFQKDWSEFRVFLNECGIGKPKIDQFELTYVNHILEDEGWHDFADLPNVFGILSDKLKGEFLPGPDGFNMQIVYRLPENQGRLYVEIVPGFRMRDDKKLLVLNLTTRGIPQDLTRLDEWFELAHRWIVRGFAEIVSPKMDKIWERKK